MSITAHILYALGWLSFGVIHSLLASQSVKSLLLPLFGRAYRLVYNLFALLYFGVLVYGGRYLIGDAADAFHPGPVMRNVLIAMMLLGVTIFIAALFQYDLGRFAGISQLFKPDDAKTTEPLQLRGLNRYVRHPLYTGAHLYLWGAVRSEFDLATAIWASAYLLIGSRFEEQRLVAEYGQAYRDYLRRVPSLIPWRGRAI